MEPECTRIVFEAGFWQWVILTPAIALLSFGVGAINGWVSHKYFGTRD